RNLTGQTVLDDSLEQAFRISLEQSRYVNVLSDLKVRNTLARMERDPETTVVDREVGTEVAQRDGARLLILPTVAEVGGRVRFSAEIVDPVTQRTLAVEARDGKGLESALPSIDAVTAALRDSMGETLTAIQKDSAPLPQVTTSSLDALRAYARGQQAFGSSRYRQAEGLYARAVEFDPDFALAYIGLMRAARAQTDVARGMDGLAKAMARRDRLPARDRLYLDAWNAEVKTPEKSLEKWQQLAELYPDYFPAYANIGYTLLGRNRYAEALKYAQRAATPQSEFAALSSVLVGQLRLALGDEVGASQAFSTARDGGVANAVIGQASSLASRRDFAGAWKAWPEETALAFAYFDRASILVDQGRWTEAITEMHRQLERAAPDSLRRDVGTVTLATIEWSSGDAVAAGSRLRSVADRLLERATDRSTPRSDVNDASYAVLMGALLAQRMGDAQFATGVLRRLRDLEQIGTDTPLGKLYTTVRANQSRLAGDSHQAVAMLEPLLDGTEPVQTHSVLLAAYRALGEDEKALAQAQWLSTHRGRAYVELGCGRCQQALNVYDSVASNIESAELQASAANAADARASILTLQSMWPADRMPDHLRRRTEVVLATFN
ncbi:MAG: putative peptide modification system cyclase, partial [Pseudoxanthomonas sp.]|nr:putative peptide modification system cyclase [Pseudoxanthomonas sp.]